MGSFTLKSAFESEQKSVIILIRRRKKNYIILFLYLLELFSLRTLLAIRKLGNYEKLISILVSSPISLQ